MTDDYHPPWLTDEELADLCKPLTQPAAQIRFLESLGLTIKQKPNGTPLVLRSSVDEVLGVSAKGKSSPALQKPGPNAEALQKHFDSHPGRHRLKK